VFKFKEKHLVYPAFFILSILFVSSLIPPLKTPLLNIFKYPLRVLMLIKHEAVGVIFYHRNLMQSERLKKEIGFLRQKINSLEEAALENARLKELLSLKQKSSYKVIAASVIGRSPDNWSSVIIINKGRRNGIKRGMVAVNYLGLIGRVIEVTESTGKIMLMNDSNFSVSAIAKRSRQEGLVSGALGSSLIMRYLPKEADVKEHDEVLTSGLTPFYPKGLLIGTVTEIGEEFSGLSRYAIIKPAVELSNIEEVLIIVQ
jgi:rod shape-determining protein MreC